MNTFQTINGEGLLARLAVGLRGHMVPNADMSKMTWFRAGGPAELLYQPADEDDLVQFLENLPDDIPLTVVGIGSNLLVRDGGIPGVVIRLPVKGFGKVYAVSENMLFAGAAVSDKRLAAAALKAGIAGFHFYHGIPGGLGGALRMNGGAHGIDTAERVVKVYSLDRKGQRIVFSRNEMKYSYRDTRVPEDLIFIAALLQGQKGKPDVIRQAMDEVRYHRETAQLVREKTAGSIFRNPGDTPAWKLIDAAGCRGHSIGGAQISEKHCNFMVNTGCATAYDLECLGETVRRKVWEHCGIRL